MRNLRVDGTRLWTSLMRMAEIGALPNGGNCRLALTDEDRAGRDLFVAWCESVGCTVSVDTLGNVFARRAGRRDDLDPVATGSHLDTQPHGGKFDGVYGVLAGLEVLRTLDDHGIETEAPLEVVVWTNEEGSRFAPAMLASSAFAGIFTPEFALSRTDAEGRSFGDELRRIGYAGDRPCGGHRFGAMFEAHIEQGPILEREGDTIGVVLGGQGQRWYDARLVGQDSHAGSTPMRGRRDAIAGAAAMVLAVEAVAGARDDAVGTVGNLNVSPNSRNTIPGEVTFSVDLRHFAADVLEAMGVEVRARFESIAAERSLDLSLDEIWVQPPIEFDTGCVEAVRGAAAGLGFAHRDIVSGAGHDACVVSKVAPTGMIFVPCEGGISHAEIESATPADLEAGCNVLLHAMLERAGVVA